jgi:hypothetical protein
LAAVQVGIEHRADAGGQLGRQGGGQVAGDGAGQPLAVGR